MAVAESRRMDEFHILTPCADLGGEVRAPSPPPILIKKWQASDGLAVGLLIEECFAAGKQGRREALRKSAK